MSAGGTLTERLGQGRQDSGAENGTQARGNANQLVNVPPALTLQPNSKQFKLAHRRDTLGLEVDEQFPYAGSYVRVATTLRVPLIPNMLRGVYKTPSMLLEDGIHPNNKGNALIASQVAQFLAINVDGWGLDSGILGLSSPVPYDTLLLPHEEELKLD